MDKKDERRERLVRLAQGACLAALILAQVAALWCLKAYAETVEVEKEVICRGVEDAAGLPETIEVEVRKDGWESVAQCRLREQSVIKEEWSGGFTFPITFHMYDAECFRVGERQISFFGDASELEACEAELLEMIGVSPEAYRITEISWAGEPYLAADGMLCRDAVGAGEKLLRDYRVRYAGTAELPESHVEQEEELPEAAEEAYTEAVDEKVPEVKEIPETALEKVTPLWKRITRTVVLIVSIGAVLFFGGLLLLAALWLVKKVRQWYNSRKERKP